VRDGGSGPLFGSTNFDVKIGHHERSECRGCLVEDGKGDSLVVVKYQYSVGQCHLNGWEFGDIRRCNDKCKNSILHLQVLRWPRQHHPN
jgi:hypothetical protein